MHVSPSRRRDLKEPHPQNRERESEWLDDAAVFYTQLTGAVGTPNAISMPRRATTIGHDPKYDPMLMTGFRRRGRYDKIQFRPSSRRAVLVSDFCSLAECGPKGDSSSRRLTDAIAGKAELDFFRRLRRRGDDIELDAMICTCW